LGGPENFTSGLREHAEKVIESETFERIKEGLKLPRTFSKDKDIIMNIWEKISKHFEEEESSNRSTSDYGKGGGDGEGENDDGSEEGKNEEEEVIAW
jgi:hypothetical protein